MAIDLNFLNHITNINWGSADQQGLLTYYTVDDNFLQGRLGTATSVALDSGEIFDGVSMGASGLGYTVLIDGLVCFGSPRDGPACFMASNSPDIKRGTLDENGDLVWENMEISSAGIGFLYALTFAGDAFFAVYSGDNKPTKIAASFDGINWSIPHEAFPASEGTAPGSDIPNKVVGGAVAAAVVTEEGGTRTRIYVSAGAVHVPHSTIEGRGFNLAWATSSDGLSWDYDFAAPITADPAAMTGQLDIGTNQQCTVAGGPMFVAAAGQNKLNSNPPFPDFVTTSAAAAVSLDGAEWGVVLLPGAIAASGEATSYGIAVVFIKTKANAGYYLCSEWGRTNTLPFGTTSLSKSLDGASWAPVLSETGKAFWVLSAIDKTLDPFKIVFI